MNIIFFGTPDFAIPSLAIIDKSKHNVLAVVTAPDKERGRGRKVSHTPIKEYALENNLTLLQPDKMKEPGFIDSLKSFGADLFVIVAFRILPKEVYEIPKFGSFNLHGSLLPKYRGAAPIQWALINGEEETGVTTFFLQDKVDTGNIIMQKKLHIESDDNLGTLHDKMSFLGAELVLQTINAIDNDEFEIHQQDDSLASPAPKITKDTCFINWKKNSSEIHNLIRGLSPYPGAYFEKNAKLYKVFKSKPVEHMFLNPGEVKETKNEIFVGCAHSTIQILEIQPEGRKRMTAEEFLRGYSLNRQE